MEQEETKLELKAEKIEITLGVLCTIESILGTEKFDKLIETQEVNISMTQKRMIFEQVFRYTSAEASALTIEQMEAELTFFFCKWLATSEKARLALMRTLLSPIASAAGNATSAPPSKSRTSSPTKKDTSRSSASTRKPKAKGKR